ncbi:hypothetical protein DFH06DRAFT_968167, partial [Mycena polygramma]
MSVSFPLGGLSNREAEFRTQNVLVIGNNGRLRFASFIRSDQTLPHEILAEIFVHCLPDLSEDGPFRVAEPEEAPLVLCGICRLWRDVALST